MSVELGPSTWRRLDEIAAPIVKTILEEHGAAPCDPPNLADPADHVQKMLALIWRAPIGKGAKGVLLGHLLGKPGSDPLLYRPGETARTDTEIRCAARRAGLKHAETENALNFLRAQRILVRGDVVDLAALERACDPGAQALSPNRERP